MFTLTPYSGVEPVDDEVVPKPVPQPVEVNELNNTPDPSA